MNTGWKHIFVIAVFAVLFSVVVMFFEENFDIFGTLLLLAYCTPFMASIYYLQRDPSVTRGKTILFSVITVMILFILYVLVAGIYNDWHWYGERLSTALFIGIFLFPVLWIGTLIAILIYWKIFKKT